MKLVIKLSGKVLDEWHLRRSLARQVGQLAREGEQICVVHGGGKQLTGLCEELGIPVVQYEGRRVTDERTLEVAKMVFSAINRDFVAVLGAHKVRAVGLAGYDGGLTTCRRRPPIPVRFPSPQGPETRTVDFGFIGQIEGVDTALVDLLWEAGYLPVIASLCADGEGQILNINSDTLAAELAVSLAADRLIAVSDVEGIYLDSSAPESLLPSICREVALEYLKAGVFTDGMIPKIESALKLLDRGIGCFQVVSGLRENGLLEGVKGVGGSVLRP